MQSLMHCSRIHDRTDRGPTPESIIPGAQIVAPVLCDFEPVVQKALHLDPGPGGERLVVYLS